VSDASDELKLRQAPLKERYREDAAAALVVLRATVTALDVPVRTSPVLTASLAVG
jgi:hypothetical protein